jgi:hypothetical protein
VFKWSLFLATAEKGGLFRDLQGQLRRARAGARERRRRAGGVTARAFSRRRPVGGHGAPTDWPASAEADGYGHLSNYPVVAAVPGCKCA